MLTIQEAAKKANVHVESVRRWIRLGKLPASLPSRKEGYRIKEEDLEDFLGNKYQIKQKGKVEAEEVLKSLAKLWNKTQHRGYIEVAYQVADLSGLLENYRKEWDNWDGDVLSPDLESGRLLESRQAYLSKWTEETDKLRKVQGELILRRFLS